MAAIALVSSAIAQSQLRTRSLPITGSLRSAGVFHVATGTWTRDSSFAHLTGPDTIYNNSCEPIYFAPQTTGERFQHRSRVPSPTGVTTDSQFYPGNNATHEFDERPGCQTRYRVNGFEFAYCSSKPSGTGSMTQVHQFAHSYTACGAADMLPDVTFTITGLPGGTASGAQICWIVGIDLDAASASFDLRADGDGTYNHGTSDQNTFGWSFGPTSAVSSADLTGPIVAGNFTFTGGGLPTPCTGTDGTIWDSPVDLTEPGTGMSSQDFFRITGATTAPGGSGCYFSNNWPQNDFYLKLYSPGCFADCGGGDPTIDFCFPGQGGVITCPCNNPPTSLGRGCNNFGAGPAFSAELSYFGCWSLANDTATLTVTGENNTSTTIFLQSPSSSSTGLVFGAGVRCLSGSLKRLYTGPASAGAISRPTGADPSIHVRSASLGDPLFPGSRRYYMTYYRDPDASGPCSNAASTFNSSTANHITWSP